MKNNLESFGYIWMPNGLHILEKVDLSDHNTFHLLDLYNNDQDSHGLLRLSSFYLHGNNVKALRMTVSVSTLVFRVWPDIDLLTRVVLPLLSINSTSVTTQCSPALNWSRLRKDQSQLQNLSGKTAATLLTQFILQSIFIQTLFTFALLSCLRQELLTNWYQSLLY